MAHMGARSRFMLGVARPAHVAPAQRFCSPVFHCYSCPLATLACPIGILANFEAGCTSTAWIALGNGGRRGAMLGSLVSGWLCPFGFSRTY